MASGLEKRAMLPVMLAVEIRDQSTRRKPIARGRLTIGAKRKVGGEKQQCYEQDWLCGFHTYFPSQGFHGKAVMLDRAAFQQVAENGERTDPRTHTKKKC